MKLKIYTMYDVKSEAYDKPFYQMSRGEAIRSFQDATNDDKTRMYAHPEDYVLFEIGSFDATTGEIVAEKAPISVAKAIDLKKSIDS